MRETNRISAFFFVLAIVILLCATSCSSARVELYSATAADLATTRIGINGGFTESSPIYRDFATFALSQVVINECVLMYSRYLERRGSKHYRLPVHIFTTTHGLAAGWNAYQLTMDD
jgi:hypothetical protein